MLRFVGDMVRAGSAKPWAKRIEKVGVVALKTLEGARGMGPFVNGLHGIGIALIFLMTSSGEVVTPG